METPLTHRDVPGGLFIGASMLLFALMNSAPAELLHLLVYAALQPSLATPHLQKICEGSQKTPAIMPASEYCFRKAKPFFEEKAALPDKTRCSGLNRQD
jgi:hypothetical protein